MSASRTLLCIRRCNGLLLLQIKPLWDKTMSNLNSIWVAFYQRNFSIPFVFSNALRLAKQVLASQSGERPTPILLFLAAAVFPRFSHRLHEPLLWEWTKNSSRYFLNRIAILTLKTPIDINVTPTSALALETKDSFLSLVTKTMSVNSYDSYRKIACV